MFFKHRRRDKYLFNVPPNSKLFWEYYRRSSADVIGLWALIILMCILYILPIFVPLDPYTQQVSRRLLPPSWEEGGELIHFLGTDDFGRDFLARTIAGGQNTITSSFIATCIALVIGTTLGLWAGIDRNPVRQCIIRHSFDVIISVPSIMIALITTTILTPTLEHATFAIAISQIPRFLISTYGAVKHEITKDYITSNILDGSSYLRLARISILPNIIGSVAWNFCEGLRISILDISAIGFLGFAAQAPEPEWGSMLASGIDLLYVGSSKAIIPGVAIIMFIASISQVGHGISRVLNAGVNTNVPS